ncbi:hypothetical protein HMPREF1013_00799 [Bacillus sp. 2_A_57_CT2]|nr:hypothetical protein HMPREF1013_00799 [Bacillus sp. 2_A_57_CT2]
MKYLRAQKGETRADLNKARAPAGKADNQKGPARKKGEVRAEPGDARTPGEKACTTREVPRAKTRIYDLLPPQYKG